MLHAKYQVALKVTGSRLVDVVALTPSSLHSSEWIVDVVAPTVAPSLH